MARLARCCRARGQLFIRAASAPPARVRSGRPVLIVPHAHDQFDNAARVVRLGCGRLIARPRYNADNATRELRKLFEDPKYAERAVAVSREVQSENGAGTAADAIEELLRTDAPIEADYVASY